MLIFLKERQPGTDTVFNESFIPKVWLVTDPILKRKNSYAGCIKLTRSRHAA